MQAEAAAAAAAAEGCQVRIGRRVESQEFNCIAEAALRLHLTPIVPEFNFFREGHISLQLFAVWTCLEIQYSLDHL